MPSKVLNTPWPQCKKDWHLPHRAVLRTEQFHTCETAKAVPSINNNKCFYFYLILLSRDLSLQNRETFTFAHQACGGDHVTGHTGIAAGCGRKHIR